MKAHTDFFMLRKLLKSTKTFQDGGGGGGRGVHLSPQTHQEYIYTRNNSIRAPVEC